MSEKIIQSRVAILEGCYKSMFCAFHLSYGSFLVLVAILFLSLSMFMLLLIVVVFRFNMLLCYHDVVLIFGTLLKGVVVKAYFVVFCFSVFLCMCFYILLF